MATPSFNNTVIARAAAALYGLQLGAYTMNSALAEADSRGVDATINGVYNRDYGTASHATVAAMVVSNLGITGAAATEATAFVKAKLDAAPVGTEGSTVAGLAGLFSGLTADATFGAAATAFNAKIASAIVYGQTGSADQAFGTISTVSSSLNLTTGIDTVNGTSGNDTFNARIFNNSNSLQSGDVVDGGAGTGDTLFADMGSSQSFAVTAETTNVETVKVRGQSTANDSADNNPQATGRVQIDAERMVGVNRWETNNSRADVTVEDVRILSSQITKDITIAMVSTDPGHVDFEVYFDQASLRSNSNTSAVLNIELMDTRSSDAGKAPLLESPFNGFQFTLGTTLIKLQSEGIDAATTYPALLAAIKDAIAADPTLTGLAAEITGNFTAIDTISGRAQIGQTITLTSTSGQTIKTGAFLTKDGTVPASSGLHTVQNTTATTSQDLVTSTIILDDVGRGSNGGDLVIGGLSTGETSTSKGVEKFDITVERASKLEVISSTANTLKEVVLVNGSNVNTAGNGALTVLGFSGTNDGTNNGHSGVSAAHHGNYGFTDVRLIDGSALKGAFTFDAQITPDSFAKYIKTTDTQSNPAGDNTSNAGKKELQVADFIYSGGSANDSITVLIDGGVAGSNSNVQVGREDFTFVVNGGAGNDSVNVSMRDTTVVGDTQFWYSHQKENANVSVNAGDGDDTVRTPGAGDVVIDLGAGNDTVYTDNTGAQKAAWVFNTSNQSADAALVLIDGNGVADIRSDFNDSNRLYKATVTVTFKGITSKMVIGSTSAYESSDLHLNQAIKAAINLDPVLSKLLTAADGPFSSLVVTALSDGDRVAADLTVSVALPTAEALTTTELQTLAAAYSPAGGPALAATYAAVTGAMSLGDIAANYASLFGDDAINAPIAGLDSVTTSDNTTTGGLGRDVIVLGTTIGGTTLASSNEVVVYSGSADTSITDYILNFDAAGNGIDQLDLTAWSGSGAQFGAAIDTNKSITVAVAGAGNQGATEAASQTLIAGLYANDNTASSHIYIVYDAATTNSGKVYKVVDTVSVAVGDVTATLMGTIDLADTSWAALGANNFV